MNRRRHEVEAVFVDGNGRSLKTNRGVGRHGHVPRSEPVVPLVRCTRLNRHGPRKRQRLELRKASGRIRLDHDQARCPRNERRVSMLAERSHKRDTTRGMRQRLGLPPAGHALLCVALPRVVRPRERQREPELAVERSVALEQSTAIAHRRLRARCGSASVLRPGDRERARLVLRRSRRPPIERRAIRATRREPAARVRRRRYSPRRRSLSGIRAVEISITPSLRRCAA